MQCTNTNPIDYINIYTKKIRSKWAGINHDDLTVCDHKWWVVRNRHYYYCGRDVSLTKRIPRDIRAGFAEYSRRGKPIRFPGILCRLYNARDICMTALYYIMCDNNSQIRFRRVCYVEDRNVFVWIAVLIFIYADLICCKIIFYRRIGFLEYWDTFAIVTCLFNNIKHRMLGANQNPFSHAGRGEKKINEGFSTGSTPFISPNVKRKLSILLQIIRVIPIERNIEGSYTM